ncbi:hypothetical protein AUEXF2481DRAFT_162808 [Aureobasidium subglaciale EXF-2481]|uniref:Uncharacterized protein n=1 Tax=Aureobasidium subglaciale (strain EXF-2481) TaxID=1043005 RepID=A0A074Z3G9_AURSE|nr:uncharacterized protein AUEXF2481DRAFT_162808 [Aureobasidium subglaciale EXF-2481]KER00853.1 hypothetical protein AUEXF2481DRAFT_162808 [Aureobasidium subglaciale EXF-2481]
MGVETRLCIAAMVREKEALKNILSWALGSVRVNRMMALVRTARRSGATVRRLAGLRDQHNVNKRRTAQVTLWCASQPSKVEHDQVRTHERQLLKAFDTARILRDPVVAELGVLQCSSCMEPLLPCRLHTCLRSERSIEKQLLKSTWPQRSTKKVPPPLSESARV